MKQINVEHDVWEAAPTDIGCRVGVLLTTLRQFKKAVEDVGIIDDGSPPAEELREYCKDIEFILGHLYSKENSIATSKNQSMITIQDKGDANPGDPQTIHLESDNDCLAIRPEGYGEASAAEGHGCPVLIEKYNGDLRLIVWADINQQDPTHIICLDGAQESRIGQPMIANDMTSRFNLD